MSCDNGGTSETETCAPPKQGTPRTHAKIITMVVPAKLRIRQQLGDSLGGGVGVEGFSEGSMRFRG
ncbi:hypothetical protein T484DRAFT_1952066 [Baffinella frigidus]|nr:hypothetical protein T484DRAFT_1952066 [Cryptophyta sp. CCMP2293]